MKSLQILSQRKLAYSSVVTEMQKTPRELSKTAYKDMSMNGNSDNSLSKDFTKNSDNNVKDNNMHGCKVRQLYYMKKSQYLQPDGHLL